MDSDFFTDGYAEKKELEEIEARLLELRSELTGGFEHSAGRSDKELEEQIDELIKRKEELQRLLADEEERP